MGIERQQAGARYRGHGGGAAGLAQHGHFSEEMPDPEPNAPGPELDLDFACGDEIHRMRDVPAPHDRVAGLDGLRAHQAHDVGDFPGVELGEQRHAGDHAPGDHEVAPVDLLGERSGDDADRQRDHDQPAEDRHAGDEAAQGRGRHHVAVADGAERDDRPPHRVRDGAELVGLRVLLDEVHRGGGDQGGAEQDDEAAEQRPALGVERIEQRAHPRRIARELEEPHDAEHQQHAQVGWQHEGEPERQHRQQIDDAGRAEDVAPACLGRLQVALRRMLAGDPDPDQVLDGEHQERDDLDRGKQHAVPGGEIRHGFERHGGEIDQDQQHDEPADDPARPVPDLLFQDLRKPSLEGDPGTRIASQHELSRKFHRNPGVEGASARWPPGPGTCGAIRNPRTFC